MFQRMDLASTLDKEKETSIFLDPVDRAIPGQ